MDWLWPAVLILFAAQSIYALVRGLVPGELIRESATPHVAGFGVPRFLFALGLPIATYNVLIAAIGIVRYMVAHGHTSAQPFVALLGAQSLAMVLAGGTPSVLASPFYLNVPIVSPAFPALYKFTAPFRVFVSVYGLAWVGVIIVVGLPRAVVQLQTYAAHARDPLRERPNGDFAVGIKIFPDLSAGPPAAAIRADSALADTIDVDAVEVVVRPGISRGSLDSLARVLDPWRRDSTTIIVAIGYPRMLVPEVETKPLNEGERLATVRRVVARLHPDILLPAEDPYGAGAQAVGSLQPARWESYLIDAVARRQGRRSERSHRRVGVRLSRTATARCTRGPPARAHRSTSSASRFFPSPYVGGGIQTDTRTADRWMRATPTTKDMWIFATGGYPLAYGERSQDDAIWQVLAWGTDHPGVKGTVVYEAGDYLASARTARARRTLQAGDSDGHARADGIERVGEIGWTGGPSTRITRVSPFRARSLRLAGSDRSTRRATRCIDSAVTARTRASYSASSPSDPNRYASTSVGQHRAAALLPDRVRPDRVRLRALELLRRHRLVAQPPELGEQAVARGVFLLRRRRDVRAERSGQRAARTRTRCTV